MNRVFDRAVKKHNEDGFDHLCRTSWQILHQKTLEKLINKRLNDCEILDNNKLEKISSQTFVYTPAEQVFIPEITTSVTDSQSTRIGEYNLSPLRLFVLEDCRVTDKGIITTSDENIILESTRSEYYRLIDFVKDNTEGYLDWLQFFSTPGKYLSKNKTEPEVFDVALSFIPYKGWTNYYHWILETLPQIRALETYKQETGYDPLIILPPNSPDFFTESLSLLGVESNQWVELSSRSAYIERLIIPEAWYWSNREYTPSGAVLDWLQKRLRSRVDTKNSPFSPNIYISRSDSDTRHVKNENEVMEVLNQFGFKKYTLSNHTVREQIQMFSNANNIVAPHGAGLVNIIFGENLNVLEFVGKNHQKSHFYCLSGLLGHNYEYMLCEKDSGHYYVDVENLYEKLDG